MKRIGLFFDRPGGEFQPLAVCKIKILPMNGRQEGDFIPYYGTMHTGIVMNA